MRRLPASAALLVVAAAALTLSGCSPSSAGGPDVQATASVAAPDATAIQPAPDGTAAEPAPMSSQASADAFEERERFFAEQEQPRDGSPLAAKTPAQQQFVAEQRAWIESQGGKWSAQTESLLLATVLDACETSILNGHRIDSGSLAAHVASSPLFAQLAGDDPAAERGLASIMVFGTEFLCPDDAAQWRSAFEQRYPS